MQCLRNPNMGVKASVEMTVGDKVTARRDLTSDITLPVNKRKFLSTISISKTTIMTKNLYS